MRIIINSEPKLMFGTNYTCNKNIQNNVRWVIFYNVIETIIESNISCNNLAAENIKRFLFDLHYFCNLETNAA